MENWKTIPGFSKYEVSDLGRIRNIRLQTIRNPYINLQGYYQITLSGDSNKRQTRMVHQLVLLAFVGPRPEGLVTRHLDGDKLNNKPSNLKYGTPSENMADTLNHGSHPFQKLDSEDIYDIRRLYATGKYTQREIAKEFGVSRTRIGHIINHKTWKHIP
jgi:hypothetical protein